MKYIIAGVKENKIYFFGLNGEFNEHTNDDAYHKLRMRVKI